MNKYIVCVFRDSIGFGCMIKHYIVTSEYNLTEENYKKICEDMKKEGRVISITKLDDKMESVGG